MELQELRKTVFVHPAILGYLADLMRGTRSEETAAFGAGPRGTLAMLNATRAYAMLNGRSFVTPEDVKHLAVPVLSHRIVREYGSMDRKSGERVINELLNRLPVPTERFEN